MSNKGYEKSIPPIVLLAFVFYLLGQQCSPTLLPKYPEFQRKDYNLFCDIAEHKLEPPEFKFYNSTATLTSVSSSAVVGTTTTSFPIPSPSPEA